MAAWSHVSSSVEGGVESMMSEERRERECDIWIRKWSHKRARRQRRIAEGKHQDLKDHTCLGNM
jgi:hypothetical protein